MRVCYEQLYFVRDVVELPRVQGGVLLYIRHSSK